MNRMLSSAFTSPSASFPSAETAAEERQSFAAEPHFDDLRQSQVAYVAPCLFAPQNYEPKYSYPLLVWLHSESSSEYELRQVMPKLSLRNHIGVAPRGSYEVPGDKNVFSWKQTPCHIETACRSVEAAVKFAKKCRNIHADRIFLAGYGAGATMALRLGLRSPEQYAGVISINGGMPTGSTPLGRLDAARRLPVMLATCQEGENYPVTQVCNDLRLLHVAGLNVDVREYECADQLASCMLDDTNRWMMQQFGENSSIIG